MAHGIINRISLHISHYWKKGEENSDEANTKRALNKYCSDFRREEKTRRILIKMIRKVVLSEGILLTCT